MFPQSASYLEEEIGQVCTVLKEIAFVATTAGIVRVFSLENQTQIGKFKIHNSISQCICNK